MSQETTVKPTRLIFIGGPTLTDGFRLIGFETLTDPDVQAVDGLITELRESRQNAFIVIEQYERQLDSKMLQHIRREGGRIVLAEVPAFNDPSSFHSALDNQIDRLLGGDQLSGGTQ